MEMFAEQAEIIHRSWNDDAFDFKGKHYTIESLSALPKSAHTPHPNLIVGGQAGPKSLAVAARWADEYNTNFANAETCRRRRGRADAAWEKAGRGEPPVFSLMTGCIVGRDRDDLTRRTAHIMQNAGNSGDPAAFLEGLPDVFIRGTVEEVADKLRGLESAGVDRAMMQMQAHDDVEMVHVLGEVSQLVG
jgi:alkanesulfonate monooxygenase SsuD/methylene tetrahydromethanopterin reductase-like flavin-dependent oxidoreductase (luciferase family)